jgi:hypothetical protein
MEDYSAYIPKGELELPAPPKDHYWEVKNLIHSTEGKSHYFIEIRLYNQDEVAVVTLVEEWDTKRESFSDFAIGMAGLILVSLNAYQSFKSINWGRDNKLLNEKESGHTKNTSYDVWISKTNEVNR